MNSLTTSVCFIDFFAYSLFKPLSKIIFGGAQIQLYLLSRELSKDKQFKISFLTDNQKNDKTEIINNVNVYQMVHSLQYRSDILNFLSRLPVIGYLNFFIRLFKTLKKVNANIYFQRAASAETGLIAIISKILGKKFIFMIAHQQDIDGTFIKNNGIKGSFYLLGLTLADKIICQTKEQQSQLSRSLKNKSLVVPSGFPIKTIAKTTKKGVLWVARAENWKNPEMFINLAKKFPNQEFIMICPPAESDPDYFKIIKLKAQKVSNLIFIEKVSFNKIDSYFKKAKVFVSTSLTEGFPNTFIQAGKNMTPIISFKVNPDKIIAKHQLGFYAKGKEDLLSTSLKKILTNQKLWLKFSINAYKYVSNNHDLKKIVKEYKKILINIPR